MDSKDRFEHQLFAITTITEATVIKDGKAYISQGSGFYYNEMSPADPTKSGPQWYALEKYWLVTNRHVVLPKIDNIECVPEKFIFCLRKQDGDTILWEPITLSKEELLSKLRLHPQAEIDVALIDITPYIQNIIDDIASKKTTNNLMIPTTLSNINLPEHQPITIDVTSDIIVASYPKGFYDKINKFPIVKSGIVASAWGSNFNGLPIFQIDAQLFPGSSGGLVISKPTNIAMIDGNLKYSKTKQFVLLGVYSGEFKWYEDVVIAGERYKIGNSYGLGNAWYSYLIPQIIKDGIRYNS